MRFSNQTRTKTTLLVYRRFPRAVRHGPPFVYPHGVEGYRSAMPLDIMLDEPTLHDLIDRIGEEIGK